MAAGKRVGAFEIERLLTRGGMGEVYLGTDLRTGRQVLLKLPAPELLGDVAAHERFRREGDALKRLQHAGVQRWVESGQDALRPYLALEYVPGESLRERLKRWGRLPVAEAVKLAVALADALGYCHARGVVHRDVKPENVIVKEDGSPVLIDFGSVLLEGARRLTFAGLTGELGTPEYMAPEQVQGKRGDARTDVYALGTLIYECLTGAPPFAGGVWESAVQVMRRHLQEAPERPGVAGVSDALLGVLAKALARDPEQRFATAAELREALADPEAAVAGGRVAAGWPARESAPMGWTAPLDEPQNWRDWVRYGAVAVGALLALVALGVAAAWLRGAQTGG